MSNDDPRKALFVLLAVALSCSVLVSVAAITLKPIQLQNAFIERSRNIIALSGLTEPGVRLSNDELLEAMDQLDPWVIDLQTGMVDASIDPLTFDARAAAGDPEQSVAIPGDKDIAALGRRATHQLVYLVWGADGLDRVIMPIVGQGMWSTLWGFVAIESDLNTIAAATFYEQAETAGLGDRITDPSWLQLWEGRQLFGSDGRFRFRIAGGPVDADSPAARHEVDGLSGASVTANAVTRLVEYWFGSHGYAAFLQNLQNDPPQRTAQAQEKG